VIQSEAAFAPAYYYLGLSYEQLGDGDAALASLSRAVELTGRGTLFLSALGHCLGVMGRREGALEILDELEARARDRYLSPYNIMLVHLGLGAHDDALAWFGRALEERNAWLWASSLEPRFDPLRHDDRFQQLVSQYGLCRAP
jgi:tetratricopeptide (TPR) repeat protein